MRSNAALLIGATFIGLLMWAASPSYAQLNLDFDAAYMVAASGSTEPVSEFELDGPPPWLYVDLPDGALTSFLVSIDANWFLEPQAAAQFSLSESSFAQADKYWFSPAAQIWNEKKAVGDWHIDARHSLVELIIIYGGGVGRVWASGSETIDFKVADSMAADFNGDHAIDSADLAEWSTEYALALNQPEGDADGDRDVDGGDFLVWQRQLGSYEMETPVYTVPEPSMALLSSLGLAAAIGSARCGPQRPGRGRSGPPRRLRNKSLCG